MACAKCAALEHRTQDHQYSEVADAVQSLRKYVEEALQELEKSRKQFRTTDSSIEHTRNRLKVLATRARQNITDKEEEEMTQMREKYQMLREEVTQIETERDKGLKKF